MQYFEKYVAEEFKFIIDFKFFEYLIDCAIILKDEKIAIEVSGS
jgi:hypothetical protein